MKREYMIDDLYGNAYAVALKNIYEEIEGVLGDGVLAEDLYRNSAQLKLHKFAIKFKMKFDENGKVIK